MIIERALFRNGANEEIVTLESITHHENYINVKENLYCIMPNCNCKLIYIPQGVKIAYFKKWKGYNHIEDCPYFKETIIGAKSVRITGKTVSRLSEEHVKKVLKETLNKFNETDEERNKRLAKQNQKARNRKNKVVEPQGKLDFEDIVVHLPTTSLDANEVREGERNPTFKEIIIDEKYSTITLTESYERLTFLEEAFYANSHLTINPMFEGLKRLYSSGKEIVVTCIGEVVLREGQFGMLIMDEEKLSFNRLPLSSLLLSKNTLF